MRYTPFALLFLLLVLPAQAQRDARIPDPDPEIERKSFKVADGFEVTLYAADPLLAKPIQMNFDAQGRLWIASSETYPQIKPGQKANDKILILEDTKGVGRADKVTVFADGLLIPTGIEPGDGGAYVANSTDLLHLSDTNGDGKADRRRILLSGFGTEDTHHILHTLRWGYDGNLYMNQSIYIHSHIETPHGPRRLNAGGVWQFRPETLQLEVFARGLVNSWGHHYDRFGQSFLTDGAGGEGVNYCFPGAAYVTAADAPRILRGLNPGSPKYCGLEIVSGRHLPDDWQGNLITCDFRAHRVCRFVLAPSGSGYTARLMPDVIRASHPAFRPVDVKMGPDGAIYIADWYNPIIQHGEVDFRDPRRDLTHGRIWRVTARGRKTVDRPALVKATPAQLCKHLEAPEDWTRHFARRTLKERGSKEVLPALAAWTASFNPKNPAHEPHLLEALWTYQSLDTVEPKLLATLLEAGDPRVRAAAVRVLGAWHARLDGAPGLLERRIADEHPQVRLEAVLALGQLQSVRAAELALRALNRPLDTNLDYALWLVLRQLEPHWLPALQAGKFDFGADVRSLSFALQAVGSDRVLRPLVDLVRSGKVTGDGEVGVLALLGGIGRPAELDLVVARLDKLPPPAQARLLTTLEEAARQRAVVPSQRQAILPYLASTDENVQSSAARLAGLWRVADAAKPLAALARDEKAPLPRRRAALEGIAALGGAPAREILSALTEKGELPIRRAALIGLLTLDPGAAQTRVFGVLQADSGDGSEELFTAFLQRKGGAAQLAKALEGRKLPADVAKVGVRTARVSGRPAQELIDALSKAGGLTSPQRVLSPEQMKQLVAEVAERGDPVRGETVFRRADQMCLKCHAIGGSGGQVGPDLSSIGAAAQVDYLIESLLQPSKAIKENYHSLLVTTARGQQYTGIKIRQTPAALILRTDQDSELAIPLKDIDEQGPSKSSLMPEGLVDSLTRQELVDLVRFLSELGKTERWSVGRARVARRWQTLKPNPEVYRLRNRLGLNGLVNDPPGLLWEPVYSSVAGGLPVSELPSFPLSKQEPPVSLVRTQIDAGTGSKATLKLNSTRGISLWLDGEPLTPAATISVNLKPGVHTLFVVLDRVATPADSGLRLEIEDTPAAAGVRFVSGK